MEDIQIRCCKEADIEGVRLLLDTYWRRGHILARDEAFFRWQFDTDRCRDQIFEGPSVLLATNRDQIVGMLGLSYFDLNITGSSVPGVWMSHLLAIPEMRQQGLGGRLLQMVRDLGYEVIFGLGINEIVKQIYSHRGYEILQEMPRVIGVFDLNRTTALLQESNSEKSGDSLRQFATDYLIAGAEASSNSDVEIIEWVDSFGAGWDSLWTDRLAPNLVCPGKDSAFLNWRYTNHPAYKYEMRLARHAATGKVLGLTAFRIETVKDRSDKVLRVVEFLSTPEAEHALAHSIVRFGHQLQVSFADFLCTSRKVARALELVGFRREVAPEAGMGFPSLFQPLEPGHLKLGGSFWLSDNLRAELPALLSLDDFYIVKSDSDQDRPI